MGPTTGRRWKRSPPTSYAHDDERGRVPLMDLQGKGALVTGGSGDLGAAACEALARAGCDVAVGYVGNREGAVKTARLLGGLGRRACPLQVDQAGASPADAAVARAARGLGRL